jgi:hypothetical protein
MRLPRVHRTRTERALAARLARPEIPTQHSNAPSSQRSVTAASPLLHILSTRLVLLQNLSAIALYHEPTTLQRAYRVRPRPWQKLMHDREAFLCGGRRSTAQGHSWIVRPAAFAVDAIIDHRMLATTALFRPIARTKRCTSGREGAARDEESILVFLRA